MPAEPAGAATIASSVAEPRPAPAEHPLPQPRPVPAEHLGPAGASGAEVSLGSGTIATIAGAATIGTSALTDMVRAAVTARFADKPTSGTHMKEWKMFQRAAGEKCRKGQFDALQDIYFVSSLVAAADALVI